MAAALSLVLLPFGVLEGGVSAQNTGGYDTVRTIENTAEATWQFVGRSAQITSNRVTIDVTTPPASIVAFRPTTQGGSTLNFRAPLCSAIGQKPQSGTTSSDIALTPREGPVEQTRTVRAGQTVLFEVTALAANTDPNEVDQLDITITTTTGDVENETIFETGVNTGVFIGQIDTIRMPPSPVLGDCRLSIVSGAGISITASLPGDTTVLVETQVDVLADPFGVVFDSETGEPVDGARVTLIDVATGQPATVFAPDGVTSWPSTVISGEPITDGSGNVTTLDDGEFWFPLTFLGTYRLDITPPEPYTAPSVVSPANIAQIARPDGRGFIILDASYGGAFVLSDPTPVQVDIPLDRPGLDLGLTKTASRQRVQPGDVVFYAITASNIDRSRPRREVVVTDTPSPFLRLRPDSVRVDGVAAPDAVTIAPDGSTLTVALGDIEGGASRRVTYAMTVRADAPPGRALNDATITDSVGRVARTSVAVDIEREFYR